MGPGNRPLDLEWLEDFLALAETGNFGQAAERCHVTQPTLSMRLRQLEDELGLQLADLPVPPRHMGAFEHFYTDCFAGDVGVSTHYVVMGNLVALPAGTELAAADAQHSALRWWPLAEAQASDEVHRFTKDYVDAILLSKI